MEFGRRKLYPVERGGNDGGDSVSGGCEDDTSDFFRFKLFATSSFSWDAAIALQSIHLHRKTVLARVKFHTM